MARACARPGALSSAQRGRLPPAAFALPALRKYPIYKRGDGQALIPSASHARNALARASQQLDAGNLTAAQYTLVVNAATVVLAKCGAEPMATKKKSAKRKPAKRKATKKTAAKRKPAKRKPAKKKAAKRKAAKAHNPGPKKKTPTKKKRTPRMYTAAEMNERAAELKAMWEKKQREQQKVDRGRANDAAERRLARKLLNGR